MGDFRSFKSGRRKPIALWSKHNLEPSPAACASTSSSAGKTKVKDILAKDSERASKVQPKCTCHDKLAKVEPPKCQGNPSREILEKLLSTELLCGPSLQINHPTGDNGAGSSSFMDSVGDDLCSYEFSSNLTQAQKLQLQANRLYLNLSPEDNYFVKPDFVRKMMNLPEDVQDTLAENGEEEEMFLEKLSDMTCEAEL